MPKRAPIQELRVLNEMLARVSEPERSEHARRALEFFCREYPEAVDGIDIGDYVDKLTRLHFGEAGEPATMAFSHWHVPQLEDVSPLWVRQAIVERMKGLAGRRVALLLITGLCEAVCPPGKYWTKKRAAEYQRVRGWIDDLTCAWASRGSRLQVVVL